VADRSLLLLLHVGLSSFCLPHPTAARSYCNADYLNSERVQMSGAHHVFSIYPLRSSFLVDFHLVLVNAVDLSTHSDALFGLHPIANTVYRVDEYRE
jgi:hypothetical protein